MATATEWLVAVLLQQNSINALVTDVYPINVSDQPMAGSVDATDSRLLTFRFETPVMGGAVSVSNIVLTTYGMFNESLTEGPMSGSVTISNIALTKVLLTDETAEKPMSGAVTIYNITLSDVLIADSPTENPMSGLVTISNITLTT